MCVCESQWSTSSLFFLLSRADTSGSLCTSRHTPESPARASHTGGLNYTVYTHMHRRPIGGNTNTHTERCLNTHTPKWPSLRCSSCIKLNQYMTEITEELSFRGRPTGWQDVPTARYRFSLSTVCNIP